MSEPFRMKIQEVFFLQDGRTVLVGPVEGGEHVILQAGPGRILIEGQRAATVRLEPEMVPNRASTQSRVEVRAISTNDVTGLTRAIVSEKECVLEGNMRYKGHRDLLGIESPPKDFVPDDMTLGPRLPDGWDGDAWMKAGGGGYFLRAWNKAQGRCAVARGERYEDARASLLDEIGRGGNRVEVRVAETTSTRP